MIDLSRGTPAAMNARITIPEIAQRLGVGRMMVYVMLDGGVIPGVRVGRRWIVTRYAYEQWERTCGAHPTPLISPAG